MVRLKSYVDLTNADIDAIARSIERTLVVPKKNSVVLEGYQCATVHLVKQGFGIRYKVLPNGKRQILNVVLPGDVIGLSGALFNRALYTVASMTVMALHTMSLDAFTQMARATPNVLLAMMWLAEHDLTMIGDHLIGIGRLTPLERVANFIFEMWIRLHSVGHAVGNSIELPISQHVIGDALGLSAPHVNRMLRRLKDLGLIAITRGSLVIKDAEELQLLGRYESHVPARISFSRL